MFINTCRVTTIDTYISLYVLLSAFAASKLDIRLAGSSSAMMGRVEVNYNSGGWGTICDDLWSINDGDVACRMLGFKSAHNVSSRASFGEGTGTIWLDDVFCKGNEGSLLDCSHSGIRVHNCKHSEDSSVACSSEFPYLLVYPQAFGSLRHQNSVACINNLFY